MGCEGPAGPQGPPGNHGQNGLNGVNAGFIYFEGFKDSIKMWQLVMFRISILHITRPLENSNGKIQNMQLENMPLKIRLLVLNAILPKDSFKKRMAKPFPHIRIRHQSIVSRATRRILEVIFHSVK